MGNYVVIFHIHIIPRHKQDGLGEKGEWSEFIGARKEIEDVFEEIRIL